MFERKMNGKDGKVVLEDGTTEMSPRIAISEEYLRYCHEYWAVEGVCL